MPPAYAASPDDFAPLDAGALVGAPQEMVDPDVELMAAVATDSEEAFAQLVRKHQQALLNFFHRMGASIDCEDLAQETFVRLHRYRRQYRPSARFTTFLYHLARNVWADRGRKVMRRERLAEELERVAEIESRKPHVPASEGVDVEAALQRLSPKLREVIVLNIYQGLRYQEVAEVLGIPLGTVKSRINLALTALKEMFDAR